ncbi:uncharacterized protein LOC112590703 [Harpegnathos saltator]|uniref:uncharacterized protein LOC112590703 n=1 Tax=Harpegnathos saltator TaxID=610380 RepID=UPI000DBEEC46|nr:uncharacterized protein LOC112590703 [Harpegnathos saltator]
MPQTRNRPLELPRRNVPYLRPIPASGWNELSQRFTLRPVVRIFDQVTHRCALSVTLSRTLFGSWISRLIFVKEDINWDRTCSSTKQPRRRRAVCINRQHEHRRCRVRRSFRPPLSASVDPSGGGVCQPSE